MKKTLFIFVLMTIGFTNAQEIKSSKGEKYLPEAGDWAIGFNADGIFSYVGNSFNGNTGNNAPSVGFNNGNTFPSGSFIGKKFLTDQKALRAIANLKIGSNTVTNAATTPLSAPGSTIKRNFETTISGFDLVAGLGKEWRKGKTRLQGFYGADILISLKSLTTKTVQSDEITTIVPGPPVGTTLANENIEVVAKDGFIFGIGVQGFLGAEYFLFPKIAIGAQYTYGLNLNFGSRGNTTTTITKTGTPGSSVTADGAGTTDISLGGVGISSINLTLHF